jgi:hypothetical protein
LEHRTEWCLAFNSDFAVVAELGARRNPGPIFYFFAVDFVPQNAHELKGPPF